MASSLRPLAWIALMAVLTESTAFGDRIVGSLAVQDDPVLGEGKPIGTVFPFRVAFKGSVHCTQIDFSRPGTAPICTPLSQTRQSAEIEVRWNPQQFEYVPPSQSFASRFAQDSTVTVNAQQGVLRFSFSARFDVRTVNWSTPLHEQGLQQNGGQGGYLSFHAGHWGLKAIAAGTSEISVKALSINGRTDGTVLALPYTIRASGEAPLVMTTEFVLNARGKPGADYPLKWVSQGYLAQIPEYDLFFVRVDAVAGDSGIRDLAIDFHWDPAKFKFAGSVDAANIDNPAITSAFPLSRSIVLDKTVGKLSLSGSSNSSNGRPLALQKKKEAFAYLMFTAGKATHMGSLFRIEVQRLNGSPPTLSENRFYGPKSSILIVNRTTQYTRENGMHAYLIRPIFYEDRNGQPGPEIYGLTALRPGDKFWVDIIFDRFDTLLTGVMVVGVNVIWDPLFMEEIDEPFNPYGEGGSRPYVFPQSYRDSRSNLSICDKAAKRNNSTGRIDALAASIGLDGLFRPLSPMVGTHYSTYKSRELPLFRLQYRVKSNPPHGISPFRLSFFEGFNNGCSGLVSATTGSSVPAGAYLETRLFRVDNPSAPIVRDVNRDGVVDTKDRAIVINGQGSMYGDASGKYYPQADFTGEGRIDGQDLSRWSNP